MYRREPRHPLSLEDFIVPFGGKLLGNNRWIKLHALIPWDEPEDDYTSQFCRGFGAGPIRSHPDGISEAGRVPLRGVNPEARLP